MIKYIYCPQHEHMKHPAVCMNKCVKFHTKICIRIEQIYRNAGYVFNRRK